MAVSHKCFISYHQEDLGHVDAFIARFDDQQNRLIRRGVFNDDDIINSTNTDYVMAEIRSRYLKDSTVTIVMVGRCTWARRFVDWEIQSSLRQPAGGLPNGLISVRLNSNAILPERFDLNYPGYAKTHGYPSSGVELSRWIDEAFDARSTQAHLINNPRERFKYNRSCP
jgi:hypothetical protein